MQKTVFIFPGQGSQYVGMGRDFYEKYPTVKELFDQASQATDMDLKRLCFEGPGDELLQTENVQPAITLLNVAVYHVLKESGISPAATAGHSLGEYASLYAAGVMNFIDLMKLVKIRGLSMKEAAEQNPGGMVMPMGMSADAIEGICQSLPPELSVDISNINSPKQVIVSGTREALAAFTAKAKENGCKFNIPLKVSGPWHSRHMHSAEEKLQAAIAATEFSRPNIPFICNATGEYLSDPNAIKENLVAQLTSTVRWNLSMNTLIQDGYTRFIETGPKTVLKNLMREINKEVQVMNVENNETLEKLLAFAKQAS